MNYNRGITKSEYQRYLEVVKSTLSATYNHDKDRAGIFQREGFNDLRHTAETLVSSAQAVVDADSPDQLIQALYVFEFLRSPSGLESSELNQLRFQGYGKALDRQAKITQKMRDLGYIKPDTNHAE